MINPPGNAAAPSEAWSEEVGAWIDEAVAATLADVDLGDRLPPMYNPLEEQLDAAAVTVIWPARSGTLTFLPREERWRIADQARTDPIDVGGKRLFGQDEYCEWSVERGEDEGIASVTFTTEIREWFEHLADADRGAVLALYRDLVGAEVEQGDVFSGPGGAYNPDNQWNTRTDGPIVHLAQINNSLRAAIALAAEAAITRTINGTTITDTNALVRCTGLGDADRFSDPSIATTINGAAVRGARITLADPPGLYLAGMRTEGMSLVDLPPGLENLKPADLWQPDPNRGDGEHVMRATFAAPDGAFPLSKVRLDGRPITTGAQLAERVDVKINVLVHEARQAPVSKPCG